jgi:hypothetical protein
VPSSGPVLVTIIYYVKFKFIPMLELIKHNSMKGCGGVDIETHVFLTSVLIGREWSASRLGRFTPGIH